MILDTIASLKVGVIGDVCLDIYWEADITRSTLSRETPHHTLPVVEERFSPGAAGNVAANLKSLGCSEVYLCSVIGRDWRGEILIEQLEKRQIDTAFLLASEDWSTPAYCKPIRVGLQMVKQEDPRIDFQNFRPLPGLEMSELSERLDAMMERCDVIAVTDQLRNGVIGDEIRRKLESWAKRGKIIVVDSRENIGMYAGIIVKPNEIEASRWIEPQMDFIDRPYTHWAGVAKKLSAAVNGPCCLTLGSEGAIWVNEDSCTFVPTLPAEPPIDIVGAGDGFASALLCALGAGSEGHEAVAFAHLAASVVVRKIGTTGTASPDEIRKARLSREEGQAR
ncbi:bifunctional heptose 7-phosphate kinase/heptose 1-phosphate adenyltransferase [Paenibacillus montanisoli]|nr:PfkB family carbohydrate kinase [Paenibacillus montanisoli]